jgi:hypothetical protein
MGVAGDFFKEFGEPISIGATALGGIFGAAGAAKQGKAAKEAAIFQANVLRNNALISRKAAKETLEAGKAATQEKQVEVAQLIGEQKATLAARGIVVDEDTASDLILDAVRIGAIEEFTITTNAERQALALTMQGANFETQAALAERKGRAAETAGVIGAAGTLLATAGKVATKWAVFSKGAA